MLNVCIYTLGKWRCAYRNPISIVLNNNFLCIDNVIEAIDIEMCLFFFVCARSFFFSFSFSLSATVIDTVAGLTAPRGWREKGNQQTRTQCKYISILTSEYTYFAICKLHKDTAPTLVHLRSHTHIS